MFGYVNYGNPRPSERWLPCWHLQRAAVDGFNYLSAERLYVEPSVGIYMELEHLFGRGEPWDRENAIGGQVDYAARKMNSVERIEVEALIEHDNFGLASKTQFVKCKGTLSGAWLPVRRISKVHPWRPEPEFQTSKFFKEITAMKLKKSFYTQQDAAHKAARASDKATRSFTASQDELSHQGRKQGDFSAPLKKSSRQASGGYVGGSPFGKGK